MNTKTNISYCYSCNKHITYETSILKLYKSKSKMPNITIRNVNVICSDCFDISKYDDFSDLISKYDENLLDANQFKLFLSKRNFYVLKEDAKKYIKENRKEKLLSKLRDMKLKYVKNGTCRAYIKYGTPDLDTVVRTLYDQQTSQNERLFELLNELREKHLEYDERIPSYKKYISNGGNLSKTIENGEIEKILINESNYLSLDSGVDSDTAKDIALSNYVNMGKSNKLINDYVTKKNTIRFE